VKLVIDLFLCISGLKKNNKHRKKEVLNTLKQKSIPIPTHRKRKAFHWLPIKLANYILDTSRTTQPRNNYQKKP
jgi:hypothetical protein